LVEIVNLFAVFEVLTLVLLRIQFFWDVTVWCLVNILI